MDLLSIKTIYLAKAIFLCPLNKAFYASLAITTLLLFPIFSFTIHISDIYGEVNGQKKGPFVNQVNFIHYLDENLALQDLKAHKIDTYFYNILPETASELKNNPSLNLYQSTGFKDSFLLNPAPAKNTTAAAAKGDFNPFSIKQVRFAMNYLMNRDFIVNEIMKGYGVSMADPFGISSPEYLNIIDTVQSFGFRYSPELAEKMISDALMGVGATKDNNGKWMHDGKPISIKILIRSDVPNRKAIGELVSYDLEKIGFNVIRDYGDLNKANLLVYGSDPQDLKWNIYEEQRSPGAFVKYDPFAASDAYAPWSSLMPGAQNSAFWNYKNTTIDKITQKLDFGNFTSENERNDLLRNAVKQGIQESVRVYVASLTNLYVASKSVEGLVNDFGAGITSKFSLVSSRLDDNRTTVNVGMKQIYQSAWNNIGGNDFYADTIRRNIADDATWSDPYSGETIPLRTPWTDIQTNGPNGKVAVLPDTIIWDPVHERWKKDSLNSSSNGNSTNASATAISKVTYNLLYSKWHNGVMMDKNDVLYTNYFQHEWGTNTGPGDKTVDSEYTSRLATGIVFDRGLRFVSGNKLESYMDFWHFDKNEIAAAAVWWPVEPWEITAAEERLVTAGKLAFSRTDATSKGVNWLSLLAPEHTNMIKNELQKMKNEGYVPIALRDTVSVDEAKKRYDASIKWITQHNNAVIGNGPFYLDSYNPTGGVITIKAFRDDSYPFSVGYWSSKYEQPKLATIENLKNITRIVHIGQPSTMSIQVNVGEKPSNHAVVRYYLSTTDGSVVASGEAVKASNDSALYSSSSSNSNGNNNSPTAGKFTIALGSGDTQKLRPGPNILKLFAVNPDAYKPYIGTKTIIAIH
jgi:peptide/nickel transport system substrate-binding protein